MLPVVVGLSGGLGNQLFQYAAGRSLSIRLGVSLTLDLSWFGGQKERQFALSEFHVSGVTYTQCSWLPLRGRALVSRFSRRWFNVINGVTVWREPHFHYSLEFEKISKPVFIEGYWQSERYFWNIRDQLRNDFTLLNPIPRECSELLEEIRISEAICVHIRRGDYLSNSVATQVHGVCSIEYYQSGVSELVKDMSHPHCFVFSDDIAWVKKSLFLDCPMTVVDINNPKDVHLDLILMAACRHFVIANSSLSWWGAWLGNHAEKKVIAPSHWFKAQDKNVCDLIPADWLRL